MVGEGTSSRVEGKERMGINMIKVYYIYIYMKIAETLYIMYENSIVKPTNKY
jgi:hypothetical protein